MNTEHAILRHKFTWRSAGKLLNEGTKTVTLAEMTDSHLLHAIGWVRNHPTVYPQSVLNTFLDEADFRSKNFIFVDEK